MSTESDRPNVLLLLTDDQRFDAVAALGDPAFATPNLDRLVAEGCACLDAQAKHPLSGGFWARRTDL